jgi:hypothetical protein
LGGKFYETRIRVHVGEFVTELMDFVQGIVIGAHRG